MLRNVLKVRGASQVVCGFLYCASINREIFVVPDASRACFTFRFSGIEVFFLSSFSRLSSACLICMRRSRARFVVTSARLAGTRCFHLVARSPTHKAALFSTSFVLSLSFSCGLPPMKSGPCFHLLGRKGRKSQEREIERSVSGSFSCVRYLEGNSSLV